MTRLLLAILSWAGVAHACPKLAGRYNCAYKNGRQNGQSTREDLSIDEESQGELTTYQLNESRMIADDVARPLPDDPDTRDSRLRTWCEGDELRAELTGRYYDGNAYGGELKLQFRYTKDGGAVRQETQGSLVGPGFNYPLNSDVTCSPVSPPAEDPRPAG